MRKLTAASVTMSDNSLFKNSRSFHCKTFEISEDGNFFSCEILFDNGLFYSLQDCLSAAVAMIFADGTQEAKMARLLKYQVSQEGDLEPVAQATFGVFPEKLVGEIWTIKKLN